MQTLCIIDCPAEPHLILLLVKMKKILAKHPSQACVETRISHAKANMVYGRKTMMMYLVIYSVLYNFLYSYLSLLF